MLRLQHVIIINLQAINLEIIDCFHLSRRRCALKPRGTAPWILIRDRHKLVMHRVLMNIAQARKIALLVS